MYVTYSVLKYIYVVMPMQCDKNMSDTNELCDRISRREPEAIEQWFREYADAVYTYIYYKVSRNKDLACDIVQETFLEGIAKIAQYDSRKASMSVWLIILSRNHTKRALIAQKRSLTSRSVNNQTSKYLEYCKNMSNQLIPDEIIHSREMTELVQLALSEMPANYEEILRQHYYTGDSLKQIASIRKITEGAAKVLLHRARKSFEKTFIKLAGDSDFTGSK